MERRLVVDQERDQHEAAARHQAAQGVMRGAGEAAAEAAEGAEAEATGAAAPPAADEAEKVPEKCPFATVLAVMGGEKASRVACSAPKV